MKKLFSALLVTVVSFNVSTPLLAETTTPSAPNGQPATAEAAPAAASPQANVALADVEQAVVHSAQPKAVDPGMELEKQIRDYKQGDGRPLVEKARTGQIYFGVGQASVMLQPENRDWANARVMAYKEALLNAKADYLTHLGTNITATSMTRLFDDKSQMPSFTAQDLKNSSKIEEILNKAVAVTSGMLDEKLTEMGIDPTEFKAAPAEKKALLFERSVSETVTTRARQELSGVIPVRSFEAHDANGHHVVAVAIVASNKMRAFIDDVLRSKGDIAAKPERASSMPLDQLFENGEALINEFGIRRMYDENGFPVLISFGQAGNPYRGSDYQQLYDNRQVAFAAARAAAFGNFAMLFKSTGAYTASSTSKMSNKRIGIVRAEGQSTSESVQSTREFVQALNREVQASGHVQDLAGTSELVRWTAKHPLYDNEIDGVVYIWHPVSESNARKLRNFTPHTEPKPAAIAPVESSQAGSSRSMKLMSADDF